MSEKCICHLNGYAVKDATARAKAQELEQRLSNLNTGFSIEYDESTESITITPVNAVTYNEETESINVATGGV